MSNPSPDVAYQGFLRDGSFMIQLEPRSGRYVFYPRIAAPGDGEPLEWVKASGLGTVYSTTVVRARPPGEIYNVSLIDLDEGPRMMSRVENIAPADVRIGMRVRARISQQGEEFVVVFDPVQPGI